MKYLELVKMRTNIFKDSTFQSCTRLIMEKLRTDQVEKKLAE